MEKENLRICLRVAYIVPDVGESGMRHPCCDGGGLSVARLRFYDGQRELDRPGQGGLNSWPGNDLTPELRWDEASADDLRFLPTRGVCHLREALLPVQGHARPMGKAVTPV